MPRMSPAFHFGGLLVLKATGTAVLLISHDLTSIYRLSHRVAALNEGRVIAEGGVDAIRGNPAVIEAYLGV